MSVRVFVICLGVANRGIMGALVPYLDPSLPVDTRVHDLVSRMTLDEKAGLMRNGSAGVARLGVPVYDWWNEALHGVARAGEATVFPQAIGMAAMWDDQSMHTIASVIGVEARAKYNAAPAMGKEGKRFYGLTFWSPNINIFRDPRWGRGQETYGEDPFLTSRTGVAFVRGLQGDDPKYFLAVACAKHFAVHSGPEALRHIFDVEPDESDFRDTYLPAFEALVREAHVGGVMTAYNSVYGKPCAINPRLYGLLEAWGFDGYVTSDCGAIKDLDHTYKVATDAAGAEALAVATGLSLRCGDEVPAIATAVRRGLISEAQVDASLSKLLKTMFRLGIFDPKDSVPFSKIPFSENNSAAHAQLALAAARESVVLLKNDGTLPFRAGSLKRVLVVGPNADSVPALVGNYNGDPSAPVTILAGLRSALGSEVKVDYLRGCDWVSGGTGAQLIGRESLEAETGGGLMGDYFPNQDMSGKPVARKRDQAIGFDWSRDSAPEDLGGKGFSARWTGKITGSITGDYQLIVATSGGFRLFLDGHLAIDEWTAGDKNRTIVAHLVDGKPIPFQVEYFTPGPAGRISFKWVEPDPAVELQRAVDMAKNADAVVFVGGLTAQLEGEEMRVDHPGFAGGDRTRIELPDSQEKVLEALQATGKPVVFVLMSGSAVAIPWAAEHTNAILEAWYPGQSGGTAVADILTGRVNPAGRLPLTFYRSTADLPSFEDYRMENRTYKYFKGQALYPFGFGLSYTHFGYSQLTATPTSSGSGPVVTVSVAVKNSGASDGDEVVQIYASEPEDTHPRDRESLCGFRRVHLAAGESKTLVIGVPAMALRRWDPSKKAYVIAPGQWKIAAGASSSDIRQTVALDLVGGVSGT